MFRGLDICRPLTVAALALSGSALVACQNSPRAVERHEDELSAAGFLVKPANTPERQQMLSRLPPHKFVRESHDDEVHYVYADPTVCNCLYVGSEQAYNQYKRDRQQKNLADQQQMTAEMYSDSAWNWGAWGPWAPGFGFGGRIGW